MVFRKRKHKLPKFPDTVIPLFQSLCETLPRGAVLGFERTLDSFVNEMTEKAKTNPSINVDLCKQLGQRCKELILRYDQYPKDKQALIVGAIRYVAEADDPVPEDTFFSGLDDDIKIVNHVLEQLDIEDRFIEIS